MAEEKKQKNKKFRTIELMLYVDTTSYDYVSLIDSLERVAKDNGYRYYYIYHDKDTGGNGSILKTHIHFLLYTGRDKELTLKKLCSLLNVPLISIPFDYRIKNNIRESVKYLCHNTINSSSKFQYDYHDIITNDIDYVLRVYSEDIETSSIINIIDYIDRRDDYIKIRELVDYILNNNLWSQYRRNASIIKDIVNEHNFKLIQDK